MLRIMCLKFSSAKFHISLVLKCYQPVAEAYNYKFAEDTAAFKYRALCFTVLFVMF